MNHPVRVLFIADLNVYSKGLGRARILRTLPLASEMLSHTAAGDETLGHPAFSLVYRVAYRLGRVLDTEGTNRTLLRLAERHQPDLIWIEKGVMIQPRTLAEVRRLLPGVRLAAYSEDDMALAHNRTRAFTDGLVLYDTVFTTKAANMDPGELAALGARRVVLVDKAFDPYQHTPLDITEADRAALGADVGFVGTFETERAQSLLFLAENGIRVRVWGNGWASMTARHPNLAIEGRAVVNTSQNPAYTKTICATRINLAFLRKLNRDRQTDRSVEIPACGGFMLAERSDDHARLFDEGTEAAFFDGDDEMLCKVRHFLANEDERAAIARAGRERCLASGYDEGSRLRKMLETALDSGL